MEKIGEKYLTIGKQEMNSRPIVATTEDWQVEQWSTDIAQETTNDFTEEEVIPLLQEHPEFLGKVPMWPEDPKDEYFTLYWMTKRLLTEWLDGELESYGKQVRARMRGTPPMTRWNQRPQQ